MSSHLLALALFSSCQKDTSILSTDNTTFVHVDEKGLFGRKLKLDNSGNGNHKCPRPGSNCSKITLSAGDDIIIASILDAIEGGSPAAIISAFETNETLLNQYMEESHIQMVIDGTCVPELHFNSVTEESFVVILNSGSEFGYVFP